MKTGVIMLSSAALLACLEESALACGTCSLDSGGPGQVLMLVAMLSLPLVVAGIGYGVIRRLLAKGQIR